MFRHSESKRRGLFGILMIFRLMLSLTMFAILAFGGYQAFKYFSGTDPLQLDPQAEVKAVFSPDKVWGMFSTLLGINLSKSFSVSATPTPLPMPSAVEGKVSLKFAVVADSHSTNENLTKALHLAKDQGVKFVIGLGDYSQVGTAGELNTARKVFKDSGMPFYVTAGDHDLWESRNKGDVPVLNFNKVFGPAYQSFVDSGIRFVLVDNADNYEGLDDSQLSWLQETLTTNDHPEGLFVFLHEPLSHPTSDRVMGSARKNEGKDDGNPKVKRQAMDLISLFKEAGVTEVFAGDVHAYTRYQESGLSMTTVRALTTERNAQAPGFIIVDVLEDGRYNVWDMEIK